MVNRSIRNLLNWILIIGIAISVLFTIYYINKTNINDFEEVYIANKFIPDGTSINRKNFSEYISIMKIPSEMLRIGVFLKVNKLNQNLILDNTFKYHRIKGDFINIKSFTINESDSMKYLISDISKKVANNQFLIPILINISEEDKIFTSGVQVKDRVQIWFITSEIINNKKITKLTARYKDIPIIGLNRSEGLIKSIVLAFPADLAKKYEIEKRNSKEMKIIFNPFGYTNMVGNKLDVVSSSEIEKEYLSGKIYTLKNEIKIENFGEK